MFFSRRPSSKLMLLLEVQSSLVRGSLALAHPPASDAQPAAPEILFTQTLDIEFMPGATSTYYIQTTLESVTTMVESALRNLSLLANGANAGTGGRPIPKHVQEAHFILSSPWVISQAKTVSISFEKDTPITPERIHAILEDERARVSRGAKVETETIEEKVFDVRLNGYSVGHWDGKAARTLDISYALSISSTKSITDLHETVSHLVPSKDVSMHSSLLLQYISLRDAHSPGDTYMLVHAHGELTDMVVVRHGTCSFFGSYPIGINTIIRKLAEMTGHTMKTADSLLSLYLGHHMDGHDEKRAGIAIDAMTRNWTNELIGLAEAVREPGAGSHGESAAQFVPPRIFVIAHAHADLFEASLKKSFPQSVVNIVPVDMTSSFVAAIATISKK